MVTGLQLPLQSSPLDGMPSNSQSADSEAAQSLSFGVILKAKEKQLQQEQEVKGSSVVAALAALQTLPLGMSPIPDIEISDDGSKADAQPDPPTTELALIPSQTGSATSSPDGQWSFAARRTLTTDQSLTHQAVTQRPTPTELPDSVSRTSSYAQAQPPEASSTQPDPVEDTQFGTLNFSKSEVGGYRDSLNQAMNTVDRPAVKPESTPINLNNTESNILSNTIRAEVEKPAATTRIIEPSEHTVESAAEIPDAMIAVESKNEAETFEAQSKTPTSVIEKITKQSLPVNSSETQIAAKGLQSQQDVNLRPVEVSKFSASKTAIPERDLESEVDKPVSPGNRRIDVSLETPIQSSPIHGEADQKMIHFVSHPVKDLIDTPTQTVRLTEATLDQHSQDQHVTTQVTIPLNSEQTEKLVDAITSKARVVNVAPTQFLPIQAEFEQKAVSSLAEQVEDQANTPTPIFEASGDEPASYSTNQAVTNHVTAHFTSKQTEKLADTSVSTVQLPDSAFEQRTPTQALTNQVTPQSLSEEVNIITSKFKIESPAFARPSIVQTQLEQKSVSFAPEQTGKFANMPESPIQVLDKDPVQSSDVQFNTGQATIPLNSGPVRKPVDVTMSKDKATNSTSAQPSQVQVEFEQTTVSSAPEQVKRPVNAPAQTLREFNETSAQYLSTHSATDPTTISLHLERAEKLADITSSELETASKTPVQNSSGQTGKDQAVTIIAPRQVEKLINTTSKTEVGDDTTPIQFSPAQVEQEPVSFISEKAGKSVNISTRNLRDTKNTFYPLPTGQETVSLVSQQNVTLSNNTMPAVEESILHVENLAAPLPLSFSETEIETIETATDPQTELPATNTVQSASDPVPAQIEINPHDQVFEAKTTKIEDDKPAEKVSYSQFTTGADQKTETDGVRPTQLQQDDLTESLGNESIHPEIEKTISQAPNQAKASATTTVQPKTKLTSSLPESNSGNLSVETKVFNEKTDTAEQSNMVPQAHDENIRNNRTYQVRASIQASRSEMTSSTVDANTFQETAEVAQQPVPHVEGIDLPLTQDLTETLHSNAVTVSENATQTGQIDIDNNLTTMPTAGVVVVVGEAENTKRSITSETKTVLADSNVDHQSEKIAPPAVVQFETADINLSQPVPVVEPDLFVAGQEMINEQIATVASGTETSMPTSKIGVDKDLLTARQVTSQADMYTKTFQASQVQDLPETLLVVNETIIPEVVVRDSKQVAQSEETVISTDKLSVASEEVVDPMAVAQKPVVSSTATIPGFENAAEEYVTSAYIPSEMPIMDPVRSLQDPISDGWVESEKVMPQPIATDSTGEVIQPKVELPNISK